MTSAQPPSGLRNYLGNPSVKFPHNVGPSLGTGGDREALLDKIPDVTPLRATGLALLVGKEVRAVVYDSDISINYDPLNGSLKGANLGTVAFEVLSVTALTGFSSSSLPAVEIMILNAEDVCEGALELFTDAPEPESSSEPFDVEPPVDVVPPVPGEFLSLFLAIDEDSIDNGNPPNFFSDVEVNDDIAEIGLRAQLPFFAANVGSTITLHTGEVGDEGWFALETIPGSWQAAGPTDNGPRNYFGNPSVAFPHNVGPGLGAPDLSGDREALLDKIPDVTPLRATGLELLVDQVVCAVVYDSDISINYDPLNGSLKGANLGTVAFEVISVTALTGFSSSSLPAAEIMILNAEDVCEAPPAATEKIVFVTSQEFDGNLGGLAGADAKCNAAAADLPGTYTAWLSDSSTDAIDRVTQVAAPYIRTDDVIIADDFADLTNCAPTCLTEPIDKDENGDPHNLLLVWTGTLTNGLRSGLYCQDWTSNSADDNGNFGNIGPINEVWTMNSSFFCGFPFGRLYCFQD